MAATTTSGSSQQYDYNVSLVKDREALLKVFMEREAKLVERFYGNNRETVLSVNRELIEEVMKSIPPEAEDVREMLELSYNHDLSCGYAWCIEGKCSNGQHVFVGWEDDWYQATVTYLDGKVVCVRDIDAKK